MIPIHRIDQIHHPIFAVCLRLLPGAGSEGLRDVTSEGIRHPVSVGFAGQRGGFMWDISHG